jgi:hypothetical protein
MADDGGFWPPEGQEAQERQEEAAGATDAGYHAVEYEYDEAPFVMLVQAHFPADRWSAVYFSWLSFKGFIVGVHHVEATRVVVTQAGREVYAWFQVTFSSQEALGAWLEYGYPIEEMLRDLGVSPEAIRTSLAREIA